MPRRCRTALRWLSTLSRISFGSAVPLLGICGRSHVRSKEGCPRVGTPEGKGDPSRVPRELRRADSIGVLTVEVCAAHGAGLLSAPAKVSKIQRKEREKGPFKPPTLEKHRLFI